MKKAVSVFFVLLLIIILPPTTSYAANWYYGSGSYVSSAPIKPTTGLKFYVDYSAITTYGSSAFTSAFEWNGDYRGNVAAVAQYPASVSSFPDYFLISTDNTLPYYVRGKTYYYKANGATLGGTYPMDSTSIYSCSIGLNSSPSAFNSIYVHLVQHIWKK